ncbi:hypothetical protein U9M48_041917 [Paspalum notatum var. saurae]|uniref:Uncharacterized protein n=1 Tax=Paspalum notatum var. saurae TaxID=547442 RepID=A0AAQ3UQB2_PASNO
MNHNQIGSGSLHLSVYPCIHSSGVRRFSLQATTHPSAEESNGGRGLASDSTRQMHTGTHGEGARLGRRGRNRRTGRSGRWSGAARVAPPPQAPARERVAPRCV